MYGHKPRIGGNLRGLDTTSIHWQWFPVKCSLGMDPKEFVPFYKHLIPGFEYEELEEDERTVTFRDELGRVRKALKEGSVKRCADVDGYLPRFPGQVYGGLAGYKTPA